MLKQKRVHIKMPTFLKPSLAALAVVAGFGILVHDMHLDRMATVAIGVPAALATYGLVDNLLKKSDHTHVERAAFAKHTVTSMRANLPKVQPRDDDRRYIQSKKVFMTGGGELYSLWPSV